LSWLWTEDDAKGKNARNTDKMKIIEFFVFMCVAFVVKVQVNVRILAN